MFNKGDFLKYDTKPGSFVIFEGLDLMTTYQYNKKYSVAVYFDPSKYCENENGVGWGVRPVLEVASPAKHCEKTVDTLVEDYFWKRCTETEKQEALLKLAEYGLLWDEEKLELINIETKNVVYKIISPKLEYNGDVIKPIRGDFKGLLKSSVLSKNTYTSTNFQFRNQNYEDYDDYSMYD